MRSLIAALLLLTLCGCGTTKVIMVSATNVPEATEGFLRLAQDSADCNVQGREEVVEVDRVGGMYLVHKDELKVLVENTRKLIELKKAESE